MRICLGLVALAGLGLAAAGDAHQAASPGAAGSDVADDHLRAALVAPQAVAVPARVVADPRRLLRIAAAQPGTVQPARGLQPGRAVRAGELLGWFEPALPTAARNDVAGERATARRDAAIGRVQVERFHIDEAQQFEQKLPTPTLQILTEYRSANGRADALGLPKREELRAPRDGLLLRMPASAGRLYQVGDALFEIDAAAAPVLVAEVVDDDLDPAAAREAVTPDGQHLALAFLGSAYDAAARVDRALYAAAAGAQLPPVNDRVRLLLPRRVRSRAVLPAGAGSRGAHPEQAGDGALRIDKTLQRRLGLRTVLWPPATEPAASVDLIGEVAGRPDAPQAVIATEAGRLEADGASWPLAGRAVHRGEWLAWLRPVLGQREAAERRAQIADLDQKLVISQLTVERLALQKAGAEDSAAQGNVYYEQSRAEHEAMVEQRRLLVDSLEGRRPLRAPADGRLSAVRAANGEVVAAGQAVFELVVPGTLRIVATSFDPQLVATLRSARLVDGAVALAYRGSEPLADAPGWRLLFDLPSSSRLLPGQLARIRLALAPQAVALPRDACVLDAQGRAQVWLHEAAERFVARPAGDCLQPRFVAPRGTRLVTEGAALLAGY